jgi:F420-dependent oxidoreductase-like protein
VNVAPRPEGPTPTARFDPLIRVGLQMPNFTFPGVADDELFDTVARVAVAGEQAGFDSVWVMDHFYQLPILGPPDANMLESYALLGALAARTATARLGTLVTGVTYRNPAILAKQVTTLDVLSRGRAVLGIGAAWYEQEHDGLGVAFPPVGERMDRLEEALEICRAMFRDERPTFEGRYYRIHEAFNRPAPVQDGGPPILVSGSGEKRTLRIAARQADAVNLITGREDIPRKIAVLAAHCEAAGRDPATLNKTWLASAIVGSSVADAHDVLEAARGVRLADLDEDTRRALMSRLLIGTPESITQEVMDAAIGPGLDGVILNFPVQSGDAEAVAGVGAAVRRALDR